MAAHRYWRVYITAVQSGGYTSMDELEMYAGAEMTNVCSGGTASASSTGFGWSASNAFNGSIGEPGWHSLTNNLPTTPEWLQYDFGSGNDKDISQIKMVMRNGNGGQAPKDFQLQYSDNGSSWTTLFTVTGQTGWGTYYGTMCFDSSGRSDPPPTCAGSTSKVVWRVRATATDGGNEIGIGEMEMRITPGGADQTSGGTACGSCFSEGTYAAGFDNNSSVFWSSSSALAGWLGYKFSGTKELAEVVITSRGGGFQNQAPKDFTIDYWDVDHWQTAHTYTGETGWTASQSRTYTFGTGAVARPVVFACT
jgi:hypothetical protein